MENFNPLEKVEQMLIQKSTKLALESAELRVIEYTMTNNAELVKFWEEVRNILKDKVDAEAKILADDEAVRFSALQTLGDESYAEFYKLKDIESKIKEQQKEQNKKTKK